MPIFFLCARPGLNYGVADVVGLTVCNSCGVGGTTLEVTIQHLPMHQSLYTPAQITGSTPIIVFTPSLLYACATENFNAEISCQEHGQGAILVSPLCHSCPDGLCTLLALTGDYTSAGGQQALHKLPGRQGLCEC
jgi:hypothetical protein